MQERKGFMDWITNLEEKKKIRKMAGRMLGADFRNLVCGWKVVFFLILYLGFFILPYVETEDYNAGAFYYCAMWSLLALNAQFETVFNYLPLSTRQIRYYLYVRTNYLQAGSVLFSIVTVAGMKLLGFTPFWERGLLVLLFLLMTNEWVAMMTMYGYSKPEGVGLFDQEYPKGRRIRIICYNVYSIALLLVVMIYLTLKDNREKELWVMVMAYLILFAMREDVRHWVSFSRYTKAVRRGMFAAAEKKI